MLELIQLLVDALDVRLQPLFLNEGCTAFPANLFPRVDFSIVPA